MRRITALILVLVAMADRSGVSARRVRRLTAAPHGGGPSQPAGDVSRSESIGREAPRGASACSVIAEPLAAHRQCPAQELPERRETCAGSPHSSGRSRDVSDVPARRVSQPRRHARRVAEQPAGDVAEASYGERLREGPLALLSPLVRAAEKFPFCS